MGSQRVGHDWVTFTLQGRRKKRQGAWHCPTVWSHAPSPAWTAFTVWKSRNRSGKSSENSYFLTPHPKFPKKPSPNSLFPFFTGYCSVDNERFLLSTFWLPGGECTIEKGQTLLVSRTLFRVHPPSRGNPIHVCVEFHKENSRRPNLQIQRMLERVKQDPSYLPLEGTQNWHEYTSLRCSHFILTSSSEVGIMPILAKKLRS